MTDDGEVITGEDLEKLIFEAGMGDKQTYGRFCEIQYR